MILASYFTGRNEKNVTASVCFCRTDNCNLKCDENINGNGKGHENGLGDEFGNGNEVFKANMTLIILIIFMIIVC